MSRGRPRSYRLRGGIPARPWCGRNARPDARLLDALAFRIAIREAEAAAVERAMPWPDRIVYTLPAPLPRCTGGGTREG